MKRYGSAKTPEELSFYIGSSNEVFRAVGACPGGLFVDLAAISEAEGVKEKVSVVNTFFEAVLTEESWEKFEARFKTGAKKNPISMKDAMEAFQGLVEVYAGDDLPTGGV